jgi:hypothetical protein
MAFILRVGVAGIVGSISYLFVHAALRPRGWSMHTSLTESENYFALGIAIIVFGIVLWRLSRQTWGKEQVDKLLQLDDSGY